MSTRRGRSAPLPPASWKPRSNRNGTTLLFLSEDGTQQLSIDFSKLPTHPGIQVELAVAAEAACGPMGTWKRVGTAKNILPVAKELTRWIATTRPELETLADLTPADARMLALSLPDNRRCGMARTLLRNCAEFQSQAMYEFARQQVRRTDNAREPYTAAELDRIRAAVRGIARNARDRIRKHRALIADLRAGRLDLLDDRDPRRQLALVLDHCERSGDIPRSDVTGAPNTMARRLVQGYGRGRPGLMSLIHLTPPEAWAFAVLLAALTGFNASVLDTLPARHLLATRENEATIALVETNKPRRGANAKTTLPLTSNTSDRPATSLTTPAGVYSTLVELTELARNLLGTDSAFVFYCGPDHRRTGAQLCFRAGLPNSAGRISEWMAPWMTGDGATDDVLSTISLDRLRKTRIEMSRIPIGQSRSTHHHYLRRMNKVREEGYGIVREALDDQVAKALTRRKIKVVPAPSKAEEQSSEKDTVLGACTDFEHSPLDNGNPCRQAFLTCLDCANARAFPRHLPVQLLLADRIHSQQAELPSASWVRRYAGTLAQLNEIFTHYTAAQITKARGEVTTDHGRLVDQLLRGELDPV